MGIILGKHLILACFASDGTWPPSLQCWADTPGHYSSSDMPRLQWAWAWCRFRCHIVHSSHEAMSPEPSSPTASAPTCLQVVQYVGGSLFLVFAAATAFDIFTGAS